MCSVLPGRVDPKGSLVVCTLPLEVLGGVAAVWVKCACVELAGVSLLSMPEL